MKERMTELINFNVTLIQRDRIERAANARGWTVAQLLREIIRTSPLMTGVKTESAPR